MKKLFRIILVFMPFCMKAQNYQSYPIKEQYDFLNQWVVSQHSFSIPLASTSEQSNIGDGISMILATYLNMYKTTRDKAYLMKLVNLSLKVQEVRHDTQHPSDPTYPPKWTMESDNNYNESLYQDGLITWPMADFVKLVKTDEPSLYSGDIPQSLITVPSLFNSQNFTTFGSFAEWLQSRVIETVNYIITNNWDYNSGFLRNGSPLAVNWESALAMPMLLIGLAINESSYLDKAGEINTLFKSDVPLFHDPETFHLFNCEEEECFTVPVLQNYPEANGTNSFVWIDWGWSGQRYLLNLCDCSPDHRLRESEYFGAQEDIAHAVTSLLFPRFCFDNSFGTFNLDDMRKFRNTFTRRILGVNGFNFTVWGESDRNKIESETVNKYWGCPNGTLFNCLKYSSLSWMPFYKFDVYEPAPNLYDIIMDFYGNNVMPINTYSEYQTSANNGDFADDGVGQHYYGLSEVVSAQWDKECPDLTLYNRDVVYDQDFFAKNELTVAPRESDDFYAAGTDEPFAEPKTFTDGGAINRFVIEPGVTVNLTAGTRLVGKKGFHAKAGSHVHAYRNPALYDCTQRLGNVTGNDNGRGVGSYVTYDIQTQNGDSLSDAGEGQEEGGDRIQGNNTSENFNKLHITIDPNPATDAVTIGGLLPGAATEIILTNSLGQELEKRQIAANHYRVALAQFPAGIYFVTVKTQGEIFHGRFVKK